MSAYHGGMTLEYCMLRGQWSFKIPSMGPIRFGAEIVLFAPGLLWCKFSCMIAIRKRFSLRRHLFLVWAGRCDVIGTNITNTVIILSICACARRGNEPILIGERTSSHTSPPSAVQKRWSKESAALRQSSRGGGGVSRTKLPRRERPATSSGGARNLKSAASSVGAWQLQSPLYTSARSLCLCLV